jgi:hypothetical protein
METFCPRQWLFSETSQLLAGLPKPKFRVRHRLRPEPKPGADAKLEGFRKTAIRFRPRLPEPI